LLGQEEANRKGAIGLFREKYEDKVSIYEIGPSAGHSTLRDEPSGSDSKKSSGSKPYSVEYCGGPHVEHTAQVGKFKIMKEEALGAGQRRIRATLS